MKTIIITLSICMVLLILVSVSELYLAIKLIQAHKKLAKDNESDLLTLKKKDKE